jgi:hypothetical protein
MVLRIIAVQKPRTHSGGSARDPQVTRLCEQVDLLVVVDS